MLYKLLVKSFLRQTKHYLVYFLSMTFSVIIYYSFRSMTYDQPLVHRVSQDVSINGILNMGSFMIAMILLFFMFSVNRFFLRQREQEFGLYQLFGLRKSSIALLYFFETFVIGLLSVIVGLSLGVIYSKLFSMVLIKIMGLDLPSIFFISSQSIIDTIIAFFFSLLIVASVSAWSIWRYPMIRLFRTPEYPIGKKLQLYPRNYVLGVLGVGMLSIGYTSAIYFRKIIVLSIKQGSSGGIIFFLPLLIFLFSVAGTYLFFSHTMKCLLGYVGRRKENFRGLNLLLNGNLKVHYLKNWRTSSMIAIVLGIALAMIGGTASLATVLIRTEETASPVSYQLSSELAPKVRSILRKNGQSIENRVTLHMKAVGSTYDWQMVETKTDIHQEFQVLNLVSITDYERFRDQNPDIPPIHLKSEKEVVLLDQLQSFLRNFSSYGTTINLPDEGKVHVQRAMPDYLGDATLRYSGVTLVVSQKVFDRVAGVNYQLYSWNAVAGKEEVINQQLTDQIDTNWTHKIYYDYQFDNQGIKGQISQTKITNATEEVSTDRSGSGSILRLNFSSRFPRIRAIHRQTGLYLYVSLFVGVITVMTTGSILMVRQLAEAEEERDNFLLLEKLGIPLKKIKGMIYQQNALVFFPPMLLGIGHAVFAIAVYSQFIATADYWLAYLVCGLLVVTFVLFYLITSRNYFRAIEE